MLTPEQMGLLGAALLTKQDGRVLSIADSNLSNAQALEADGHVRLWHTGLFWVIAPTETGQQVSTKYEAALSPIQFSADSAGYAADLTDEQRMIIAHDGVPTKPAPRMWGDHESSERQAEYEQRIGYKLSPMGNYVYRGPRSTDPQDQPIPKSTPEEREANRGFFERWHEERKSKRGQNATDIRTTGATHSNA